MRAESGLSVPRMQPGDIQQLPRVEEERRIGRPAVALVAGREGLVDQDAPWRQGREQVLEQRAVQIVDHYDPGELPGRVWPGPALQVGAAGGNARHAGQPRKHGGIPVDRLDQVAEPGQKTGMPPAARRHVQDSSTRRYPVRPADDPRRGGRECVRVAMHIPSGSR